MRIDFKRLIILYVLSIVISLVLGEIYWFIKLYVDIPEIVFAAITNLALAVLFTYFNYPRYIRSKAHRDPNFPYNLLGFFLILMLFSLLRF